MALSSTIDVREGEVRPLALAAGVLGFVVAGHTVIETARDALFLTRLPAERLPLVYALLAGFSLAAGAFSTYSAARFGRRSSLVASLIGSSFLISLLYSRPLTPVVVFSLYLLSGVMGTVLTLQFWLLVGRLFTVAQGKRLFGPIASGGVLGAALGGGMAALALRLVPEQELMLVGVGLFLCAGGLVGALPSGERAEDDVPRHGAFGWVADFGEIWSERYVSLVAIVTLFATATVLIADYLFKASVASAYPKEQLGTFFAIFYTAQNAVALLVQVLLTGVVVRKLGVTGALIVLPMLLLLTGTSAALGGGLAVALAAKGADGSLRHSLHRVTSELLLLPLASRLRDKAKPLIDTVFGRGTQALVSAGILGLTALGLGSLAILGGIMGIFAALWIGSAIAIRGPYLDQFRRAIARGELPAGGLTDDLDLASVEAVMEALSSRDEDRVMAAIDVLFDSGRIRILPALILYHDSPRVLARGLDVIARDERRDWIGLAERLLDNPSEEVRGRAVAALAAAGHREVLVRALKDSSAAVRAKAAFFACPTEGERADCPEVRAIIESSEATGPESRMGLLQAIGDYGDPSWKRVVEQLIAKSQQRRGFASAAAHAIARIGDPSFLPYLLGELRTHDCREDVREAIVSMGRPAAKALLELLSNEDAAIELRLEVPRVLAFLPSQRVVDQLTAAMLRPLPGALRFRILRSLGRIVHNDRKNVGGAVFKVDARTFERLALHDLIEHFRIRGLVRALGAASPADQQHGVETSWLGEVGGVLEALLGDKRLQSLQRVFRQLGLAHPNEDLESVYGAVVGADPRRRASALELLGALPVEVLGLGELLPLLAEDLPEPELLLRAHERGAAPLLLAHDEAVLHLLEDADELLAALAAYHALETGRVDLARRALSVLEARPALAQLGAIPQRTRRDSNHG